MPDTDEDISSSVDSDARMVRLCIEISGCLLPRFVSRLLLVVLSGAKGGGRKDHDVDRHHPSARASAGPGAARCVCRPLPFKIHGHGGVYADRDSGIRMMRMMMMMMMMMMVMRTNYVFMSAENSQEHWQAREV